MPINNASRPTNLVNAVPGVDYSQYKNDIWQRAQTSTDPFVQGIYTRFKQTNRDNLTPFQWQRLGTQVGFVPPAGASPTSGDGPIVGSPKPNQFPAAPIVPQAPTDNPFNGFNTGSVPTGNPDTGLNNALAGIANTGYSSSPMFLTRYQAPQSADAKGGNVGNFNSQIMGTPYQSGSGKLQRQSY